MAESGAEASFDESIPKKDLATDTVDSDVAKAMFVAHEPSANAVFWGKLARPTAPPSSNAKLWAGGVTNIKPPVVSPAPKHLAVPITRDASERGEPPISAKIFPEEKPASAPHPSTEAIEGSLEEVVAAIVERLIEDQEEPEAAAEKVPPEPTKPSPQPTAAHKAPDETKEPARATGRKVPPEPTKPSPQPTAAHKAPDETKEPARATGRIIYPTPHAGVYNAGSIGRRSTGKAFFKSVGRVGDGSSIQGRRGMSSSYRRRVKARSDPYGRGYTPPKARPDWLEERKHWTDAAAASMKGAQAAQEEAAKSAPPREEAAGAKTERCEEERAADSNCGIASAPAGSPSADGTPASPAPEAEAEVSADVEKVTSAERPAADSSALASPPPPPETTDDKSLLSACDGAPAAPPANQDASEIQLILKPLAGPTLTLMLPDTTTVAALCSSLGGRFKIDPSAFHLCSFVGGSAPRRLPADGQTLRAIGLAWDNVVTMKLAGPLLGGADVPEVSPGEGETNEAINPLRAPGEFSNACRELVRTLDPQARTGASGVSELEWVQAFAQRRLAPVYKTKSVRDLRALPFDNDALRALFHSASDDCFESNQMWRLLKQLTDLANNPPRLTGLVKFEVHWLDVGHSFLYDWGEQADLSKTIRSVVVWENGSARLNFDTGQIPGHICARVIAKLKSAKGTEKETLSKVADEIDARNGAVSVSVSTFAEIGIAMASVAQQQQASQRRKSTAFYKDPRMFVHGSVDDSAFFAQLGTFREQWMETVQWDPLRRCPRANPTTQIKLGGYQQPRRAPVSEAVASVSEPPGHGPLPRRFLPPRSPLMLPPQTRKPRPLPTTSTGSVSVSVVRNTRGTGQLRVGGGDDNEDTQKLGVGDDSQPGGVGEGGGCDVDYRARRAQDTTTINETAAGRDLVLTLTFDGASDDDDDDQRLLCGDFVSLPSVKAGLRVGMQVHVPKKLLELVEPIFVPGGGPLEASDGGKYSFNATYLERCTQSGIDQMICIPSGGGKKYEVAYLDYTRK